MARQYYINRNDKVRGPFSEGRIQELRAEGKLRDDDLTRFGDKGDWQPLSEVLDFQQSRPAQGGTRRIARQSTPTKPPFVRYAVLAAGSLITLLCLWGFFLRGNTSDSIDTDAVQQPGEALTSIRPDILFEDFEGAEFGDWTVEGGAFGDRPHRPASSTSARNALLTPANGQQVADSYVGSDFVQSHELTGRLISPPFTIERNYINFWIAGGEEGAAQAVLRIDGKVQRTSVAQNKAMILQPNSWEVSEFSGKTATIEILDESKKPGGHICVDSFVFSDADLSSKNLALVSQAIRDSAREWKGRRYYFSSMKAPFEEAREFASQVGGNLLCLESPEETDFIRKSLTDNVWLGIEDKDRAGSWIGSNQKNYTHGPWRDGAPEYFHQQFAVVSPAGLWQDVRSPADSNLFVIEFGESQSPPAYEIIAPGANRRAAQLLQEKKCAFGVVTSSAYRWVTSNTPLPIEDFELRDIRFPKGTSLRLDDVELLKEVKGITRLDLDACDDSVLEILKYTPKLRCVAIYGGQYHWSALKYLQPGHPMRAFGLSGVTVSAEQLRPVFQAAQLNHFAMTGMSTSPEVADLLLQQKATLQHLGFNGVSGLGKAGIQKLGELTQLQSALFWGIGIDDETLPAIGQLQNLTTIQLGANHGLTGRSLASLSGLGRLESMSLWSTGLDDAGLQNLPPLPSLKSITVGSTKVTDVSIGQIALLPQIRSVSIDGTAITSVGLQKLRSKASINHVVCSGSKITKQAIDDFARDRPEFQTDLKAENPAVASIMAVDGKARTSDSPAQVTPQVDSAQPPIEAPEKTSNPARSVAGEAKTETHADFPCDQLIAEIVDRPDYGKAKAEINRRVKMLQSILDDAGISDTTILVGKIELSGAEVNSVDSSVVTQCEVFSNGYFVTPLADRSKPLFVAAHHYFPAEIRVPPDTDRSNQIIHIAPIKLRYVTKLKERIIAGNVSLRPASTLSRVQIELIPSIKDRTNIPVTLVAQSTFLRENPGFRPPRIPLNDDGTFRESGVPPMPYKVVVRCLGYATGECEFDGNLLTPENVFLEAVPKYRMTVLTSEKTESKESKSPIVWEGSHILDDQWFHIGKSSTEHSEQVVIKSIRPGLLFAELDSSPVEAQRKNISKAEVNPFDQTRTIQTEKAYLIRPANDPDKWLVFSLSLHSDASAEIAIREIGLNDIPGEFLNKYVLPLQKQLSAESTPSPSRTQFGLAGLVLFSDMPVTAPPIAAELNGTSGGYVQLLPTEGAVAFGTSSPVYTFGGNTAVLSVRSFGYEPFSETIETTEGKLNLVEVTMRPTPKEQQSSLSLSVTDAEGKPVVGAEVSLSFATVSSSWFAGTFSGTWTETSDRSGHVTFPSLSSDWYRLTVRHAKARFITRNEFINVAEQRFLPLVLLPRRTIRLQFVGQPNGSGEFAGEGTETRILEGDHLPLGENPGSAGYLRLSSINSELQFGLSHSGSWITDLGPVQWNQVTDAMPHLAKVKGTGYSMSRAVDCKLNHIYILESSARQHVKFKVLEILEP